MPESKGRAKPKYTPPAQNRPKKTTMANPPWFVPVMLGLMLVGLIWVVTFYIVEGKAPIPGIGYWNLIIGFSLMISGFMMTTRWR
ncbi:MAG: cell division protein CrgA [Actinomycetota bacterium]